MLAILFQEKTKKKILVFPKNAEKDASIIDNGLLLNIYFHFSGFQSSLLLFHFRDGPNRCSHCTEVWQNVFSNRCNIILFDVGFLLVLPILSFWMVYVLFVLFFRIRFGQMMLHIPQF